MNALITGASSGIGRAIAMAIASAGGAVCLVGRDRMRLEAVARAARAAAHSVSMFRADLSVDHDIDELARHVKCDFGAIDTLIHAAGAYAAGSVEQMPVAQLDELYRINVRAPYAVTQAFLPYLRSRKGQVVFINSSQGLKATADTSAYASTKHAVKAMADALRREANAQGIRVLSIYPGRTATPMIKTLYEDEARSYEADLLQPGDIASAVLSALQLPRTAEITDIRIRPFIKSH